ncbi:hypothetical protein CgunFtcFv8_017546 [Champsocephalus gunnari]|uniref:Uncharacterized protein n=1 Tax=Champsocephalus gunnari TaxID=52237 RepID=A0AAN8HQV1_CHAGU|nr:hypothetical protein CgunFtcFv8_017546 [Champsocephalus gunnari]
MKIEGPARTRGGPERGARQDRTKGLGRTRVFPGRKGPEGMEGRAEGAKESMKQLQQLLAKCTPEGARGAG